MSAARWLLLNGYYHASYPLRAARNARLFAAGRAPVMVLFYHRIADEFPNDWTASWRSFRRQIRWLKRHFEMVSLAEAQHRIRQPRNETPTVTITFDDGYRDNCRQALPLLIDEQIPCTYFVSTRHVLEGRPFGHDVALGQPLAPNTPEEIIALAAAGIDIGAHTRTHADLGPVHDPERLLDEMVGSQQDLETLTGRPVRYFAFPYGQHRNLSGQAMELARAHFDGVVSAYGGYNFPGDDPFHIQRIPVGPDLLRLKNWVTFDPRKVRLAPRFEYGRPASQQPAEVGS